MDRWLRFSGTGAHLVWRVNNGARSVPFKTVKALADGSELVVLRESAAMLGKRRRDIADPAAPRLPDTIARLIQVQGRHPHRARQDQDHHDTAAHNAAGTWLLPRHADRCALCRAMADRNGLPAPEEDAARHQAGPARPVG